MQRVFFSLLVVLFASTQIGFSQTYIAATIEKTDKEDMQYEVLGKVANHYWIYKKNGSLSTIAQYNDQMQLVKQNDLTFLPATVQSIEFITYADKAYAFYQFQVNKTMVAAVAAINGDGILQGAPIIIDTAENIRPGSNVKVFNLLQSDDHQKILLFSVNTSNPNAIKVKTTSFNQQFETIAEAVISISSVNKKSNLSDFALDNNGNLFCLRNTTQKEAAPAVSLLYLSADGKEVVESAIINNQLLLDNIRLKVDNKASRVVLNSFYATTKKGNVEGLFTYVWDIVTQRELTTSANRFTDATRAVVSKKKNLKGAFDNYYIDKINTQADGSFVVIAESAETYANRSAFSRWDYYWGGAFYNPYMFNYWNRPFGFYPWARVGWGMRGWGMGMGMGMWMNPYASFGYPSITYNANQIAMMSYDIKGNLQWAKTIDKSQSDMNVDQFIGYGSFENEQGLHFVYYQKQKGQRQFVINNLTPQGQLNTGTTITINDKRYEWMPRSLKQVGANEAIIPYQYNNKIGFAKIQLK